MEHVISKLFDIEKEADVIFSRANEQKEIITQQYEKDIKILDKELNDKLQDELVVLEAKFNKEFNNEKKTIIDNCNSQIKTLEENYSVNKDKYIDDIFNRIIH